MGEKINKEIKLKHIVGALSDKQFYSLAHMILLVIALLGSLLAIGLIVFFVIIGGKEDKLVYYSVMLFIVFCDIILTYFLVRNVVYAKKYKRYLEDCVILDSYAKPIEKGFSGGIVIVNISKIQVSFVYNKKHYSVSSKYALLSYNRYINKSIKIAYSPKHNEVLILNLTA